MVDVIFLPPWLRHLPRRIGFLGARSLDLLLGQHWDCQDQGLRLFRLVADLTLEAERLGIRTKIAVLAENGDKI